MTGSYYPVQFPQGPIVINGMMSVEWQRFFISLWNRTGAGSGQDGSLAIQEAETALVAAGISQANVASLMQSVGRARDMAGIAMLRAEIAAGRAELALSKINDLATINTLTSASAQAALKKAAQLSEDAMIARITP